MRRRGPSSAAVAPVPPALHVGRTGSGVRRPNPTGGVVANSYGDRPARSTDDRIGDPSAVLSPPGSGWALLAGLAGLVFAMGAIALEVVSSSYANSDVAGWGHWVPLAWPQPLRVGWWLAVAAAGAGFHWSLGLVGLRPSRFVTALTVGPFVAFAAGIGLGADWATWH